MAKIDTWGQTMRYIEACKRSDIRATMTLYGHTQVVKCANMRDAEFIRKATIKNGGTFEYIHEC